MALPQRFDLRAARLAALTPELHAYCQNGVAVWVDGVYAGFINRDADETELAGLALTPGAHVIELRPQRWFWDQCRINRVLAVTVAPGGAITTQAIPDVANLVATVRGGFSWLTWDYAADFATDFDDFALWFGPSSPVATSGAPAAVVAHSRGTAIYQYRRRQTASEYVAIAARASGVKGTVAELALPWNAVLPDSPANQYAEA